MSKFVKIVLQFIGLWFRVLDVESVVSCSDNCRAYFVIVIHILPYVKCCRVLIFVLWLANCCRVFMYCRT